MHATGGLLKLVWEAVLESSKALQTKIVTGARSKTTLSCCVLVLISSLNFEMALKNTNTEITSKLK